MFEFHKFPQTNLDNFNNLWYLKYTLIKLEFFCKIYDGIEFKKEKKYIYYF